MVETTATADAASSRGGQRLPIDPRPPRVLCRPVSIANSLEALDLSTTSPTQTLASLRFLVLSYLSDVETRLSQLETSISDWKSKGELTIEEARAWAKVALEMLYSIRADVRSHLPDFHLADMSVEDFVKSHFPDILDIPRLNDVRSHLPDINIRAHLPDVRSHLPTLSKRLRSLHLHLSSIQLPSGFEFSSSFALSTVLSDLLDTLLSSDIFSDLVNLSHDIKAAEEAVAHALKRSFQGTRLIDYIDLPGPWRNNPYVRRGYRFIPIERWPLIVLSLFTVHNESLNIHTHLVPFFLWFWHSIPFLNPSAVVDVPETAFISFALLCLLTSVIWHTMSGCSHTAKMEFCAQVDYVGIGWLISASVGTVVYYGFQCHQNFGKVFLVCCFLTGLAGNIVPFMSWFNQYEARGWRIVFFLSLAFSSLAPLAGLAFLHSTREMLSFINPILPSLVSYLIGLVFYTTHIPERFFPEQWSGCLDYLGGGSHAIWHVFIVLAISQHKDAIGSMRDGIKCM